MFNPGSISIGELTSSLKDLGILGFLVTLGWKSRDAIQPIKDFYKDTKEFFKESRKHYTFMQDNMSTLLNNHLAHLKTEEKDPK